MISYVDFEFYRNSYGGKTINEDDFDLLAKKSSSRILQVISEREIPENMLEKVKDCCCELAEKIYDLENSTDANGNMISSEKIGNYSVSYHFDSKTKILLEKSYHEIICRYLGNSGLLYRGVD